MVCQLGGKAHRLLTRWAARWSHWYRAHTGVWCMTCAQPSPRAGASPPCGPGLMKRTWLSSGHDESNDEAWHRPRGLPDRPGLHGDVRGVRQDRRGREHRDHPRSARARDHAAGHRRLLRRRRQRDADRPRAQRTPRPRAALGQVRRPDRARRRLLRRGLPTGGGEELARAHADPARRRSHRHLPPGAARSERPDRGHDRRDRRARHGRLRPRDRPVRGRPRDHPPRARRTPDLRPADRVLAGFRPRR